MPPELKPDTQESMIEAQGLLLSLEGFLRRAEWDKARTTWAQLNFVLKLIWIEEELGGSRSTPPQPT